MRRDMYDAVPAPSLPFVELVLQVPAQEAVYPQQVGEQEDR